MFTLPDLLEKMSVEEIDNLLYRGQVLQMGLPRVFGGQVLGQALNAAARTLDPERRPHSMHAYFLRPGDTSRPIIYEVDPIRDGRSFSTRRVVAKQGGEAIFNSSMSFQKLETGIEHQADMPKDIPAPKDIKPDYETAQKLAHHIPGLTLEKIRSSFLIFDPDVIDVRTPHLERSIKPGHYDPVYGYWFKLGKDIGNDPLMHRTLLAFIADKALMMTGILPHNANFYTHKIIGASLDHAMWFHEDIRVDEWVYYHIESPRAGQARDLGYGRFYSEDGTLIATTMQEGLVRVLDKH